MSDEPLPPGEEDRHDAPRSLVWATDLDVLSPDRVLRRREGYLAVLSPGNPDYYWGNLLLFDDPPGPGDALRWERLFEAEFSSSPGVRHRTFAWDRVTGVLGSAREEFLSKGYYLEEVVGLLATADRVRAHPRENRVVVVHRLDHLGDRDEDLWEQVVELQVSTRDERFDEDVHRSFARARMRDLRTLFHAGRGAWFVALGPASRTVLGSCGVVATAARGRFQGVDTVAEHRRRGICSRLVVEAAKQTAAVHGTQHFVIAPDPAYHALGLYESLGFRPAERVAGVCLQPQAPADL